jgi:hypothetical protein
MDEAGEIKIPEFIIMEYSMDSKQRVLPTNMVLLVCGPFRGL